MPSIVGRRYNPDAGDCASGGSVSGSFFVLESPAAEDAIRVLGRMDSPGSKQVTITRTGRFRDDRYGEFEITREMLLAMVDNFRKRVFGQDIFIDVAHRPSDGAAAKIQKLSVSGDRLLAKVSWTPYGVKAIEERGYSYLSAEFHDNWTDNETGKSHGPVLLGAGLTNRPVIKRLDPVQLSHDCHGNQRTYLTNDLEKRLTEKAEIIMDKWLKKLREQLQTKKLAEEVITKVIDAYKAAAVNLGEEEKAHKALLEQFSGLGTQLAEQVGEKPAAITLSVPAPAAAPNKDDADRGLDETAVRKILAEVRQAEAASEKKLSETLAAKRKIFDDAFAAGKLDGLSEEARKELCQVAEVVTAEMSDDLVRKLAEQQVTMGNRLIAQHKLANMGFVAPTGSVRISVDQSNAVKQLQESIDRRIGLATMPDAQRYLATGGTLQAENKALAEEVLAAFDVEHGRALDAEHKMLAAGDGVSSDVNVPVSWERTVIREALYRLVGLQFVNSGVLPFAASYSIPYSYRDTTAAGKDNTRKYEGQSISRAGVIQTADTAYNTPQKLAFEVSDELRYLTSGGQLAWDAVAENTANASRIVGEDLDRLLFNEMVHASDEYGATAVSNEDLELQADGTDKVFVLAQWPVVRPRAVYNLQGSQVGSTVNPITVTYDSVVRSEYDGTGTQSAGIYYVLDYNLGEIYLVDEAGAIQTPADTTAYTISYSYATNTYKFDTDLGSSSAKDHWDTFLYRYGLRKSAIEDTRYHMVNFGTMSGTVENQVEQAGQFAANFRVPATELTVNGNVGRIRDVPNFKTSAPGLWMADQRVVLGERGVTRLRMAKTWMMGELENQKDANGRFTGKKEAYGDQFVVLHTPTQLKRAYSSLVLYSATARVARAAP